MALHKHLSPPVPGPALLGEIANNQEIQSETSLVPFFPPKPKLKFMAPTINTFGHHEELVAERTGDSVPTALRRPLRT